MAMDEDALNDALNTPTDELDETEEGYTDPMSDDEEVQSADETGDEVDELLEVEPEVSRKENRVQKLANERREAEQARRESEAEARATKERADRLEAELAQFRNQRQQQEELELDPEERRFRQMERDVIQARFDAADSKDKQAFNSLISKNPELAKLTEDVEKRLDHVRKTQGVNPTREGILTFLLGERAKQAMLNAPQERKQAKRRVEQARGAPVGGRSDASASRSSDKGDSSEARERRLLNVRL